MLSISTLSADASYYLKEDNYYLKDVEGIERSMIGGRGAKLLGIEGKVTPEVFEKLIDRDFNIQKAGTPTRPGWDLTFSAPKSVSILAIVGGDERLLHAHSESVKDAMKVVEEQACQARIVDGKDENGKAKYIFEKTNNLAYMMFLHDVSREKDPQLHTHTVVANLTKAANDMWYALGSSKNTHNKQEFIDGFYENVMKYRNFYGLVYRNSLGRRVRELGYDTEITNSSFGFFEIKGIEQKLIDKFSKRSEQVKDRVKDTGYDSAAAKAAATLDTRKSKEAFDRGEQKEHWEYECLQAGSSIDKVMDIVNTAKENANNPKAPQPKNIDKEINDALIYAIRDLTKYKTQISYQSIVEASLLHIFGNDIPYEQINEAIKDFIHKDWLVPLDANQKSFVTYTSLAQEEYINKSIKDSYSKDKGLDVVASLESSADNKTIESALNTYQGNVVLDIKGESDKLIQGIIDTAAQKGKNVSIVLPGHMEDEKYNHLVQRDAVPQNFLDKIKKKYFTEKPEFIKTLYGHIKLSNDKDNIILVDNAQTLKIIDLVALEEKALQDNSKLIFINQVDGLKSFSQNNAVSVLREQGAYAIGHDTNIHKQRLDSIILQEETKKERDAKVGDLYKELVNKDGIDSTKIITHSKMQDNQYNDLARETLQQMGVLSRLETEILSYQPVYMSKEKKLSSKNYTEGMVLSYKAKDKKIRQYVVEKAYHNKNLLELVNEEGEKFSMSPRKETNFMRYINAIHAPIDLKVAIGEKLTATSGFEEIKEGARLTVKNIYKDNIIAKDKEGKEVTISTDKDVYLSHDYVTNIYRLEGNIKNAVSHIPATNANNEVAYALETHATDNLYVVTNNKYKIENEFKHSSESLSSQAAIKAIFDDVQYEDAYQGAQEFKKDKHLCDVALEYSLEKNLQYNSVAPIEAILEEAQIYLANKKFDWDKSYTLDDAINNREGLVKLKDGKGYTTKNILESEKSMLSIMTDARNSSKPLLSNTKAAALVNSMKLTDGQKEASMMILTSTDRFNLIDGHAGTGKSTMLGMTKEKIAKLEDLKQLSEVTAQATDNKIKFMGLAPSRVAAAELSNKGIASQTVQKLVSDYQNNADLAIDFKNTVFVIDETSMVGTASASALVKILDDNEARMVVGLGDTKQNESIEYGGMFNYITQHKLLNIANMKDIIRQQEPQLHKATVHMANREYDKAFETLRGIDPKQNISYKKEHWVGDAPYTAPNTSIVDATDIVSYVEKHHKDKYDDLVIEENKDSDSPTKKAKVEAVYGAMLEEYKSRTLEEQENTFVATFTNKDRESLAKNIREIKVKNGTVSNEHHKVTRLSAIDISEADKKIAINYANVSYITKMDKMFEVVKIHGDDGVIMIKDPDSKKVTPFYPAKAQEGELQTIACYNYIDSEISERDKIRFTKTNKELKINNGDVYTIDKIENNIATLSSNGETRQIDISKVEENVFDLNYCLTIYSSQGITQQNGIFYAKSDSPLAAYRSLYVLLTRNKNHSMIFTDSAKGLQAKFSKYEEQSTAIEHLMQPPSQAKVTVNYAKMSDVPKQDNTADKNSNISNNQENKKENISANNNSKSTDIKENPTPNNSKKEVNKSNNNSKTKEEVSEEFQEMNMLLNHKAEELGIMLFGKVNSKSGGKILFESDNKYVINTTGNRAGTFFMYNNPDKRGDLIQLIQNELGFSTKSEAFEYAKNFVGGLKIDYKKLAKEQEEQQKKEDKFKEYKHQQCLKTISSSKAIKGTIAQKYLTKYRGLENIETGSLKFNPRVYAGKDKNKNNLFLPALVCVGVNKEGKVSSAQAVFLDKNTGDKNKELKTPKRNLTQMKGTHCYLTKGKDMTLIAEGVETALSANGLGNNQIIASFGKSNLTDIDTKRLNKKIGILLDVDYNKLNSKSFVIDPTILLSAKKMIQDNKEVNLILPKPLDPNTKKYDFNDMLKEQNKEAIKTQIDKSINLNKLISRLEKNNKNDLDERVINNINKKYLDSIKSQTNNMKEYNYSNKMKDYKESLVKQKTSINKVKEYY